MRTLDDLTAFSGYAMPLIDLLDNLPSAADWGEWLDQLGALATRALKRPDWVLADTIMHVGRDRPGARPLPVDQHEFANTGT